MYSFYQLSSQKTFQNIREINENTESEKSEWGFSNEQVSIFLYPSEL